MQPVEAADYRELSLPADPRVAPDGESVAFVRRTPTDDETHEATIHLVPTAGGDPRRFTVAEGEDSQPRWSPSGDRLAFVSTRGADDDRPQLWVVPTAGGEARQVTDVVGGVSDIAWSPDGTRIAFVQRVSDDDREEDRDLVVPEDFEPEDPDPRVVDRTVYRTQQRYFDGARSQVYLVDLGDDTPSADDEVERVTDGDADVTDPTWGDAGTLYYAEHVGEDPDDSIEYEIVARDLRSGETERLHRTTGWQPALAATADGRIAHVYQDADRSTMRPAELHVYDREADAVVRPTDGFDRTLTYEASPQWGPDEETLYFSTPDAGRVPVWRVHWQGGGGDGDAEGADERDADGETAPGPERVVDAGHVSGAHVAAGTVALVQSEWDHPGDVFVASTDGGEPRRLTRLNEEYLADRAIARPEELWFDSDNDTAPTAPGGDPRDGEGAVQGWLLTPPEVDNEDADGAPEGTDDGQYPLVVEVHGGPHAMWSTADTMWHEFQTLAARGYAVFWCNPRGSTGYGADFAAAIADEWGPATTRDVLAGVETVSERPAIDADQQFLTGGSFGGYMTSWLVGHDDRFAAAVTQRGVHDLSGFYGSTDAAYRLVEDEFGTTPWEDPETLAELSPVTHVDDVTTPTLVLHSDEDYRTPANTAELFHRGLRKHGVDTRLVRYPREGHELSRSGEPGHVVDRIERIARWFDGYSEYHDAPRALDRPDDAGLSAENETTDDPDE